MKKGIHKKTVIQKDSLLLILIVLAALLVFSFPAVIRSVYDYPIIPGTESYKPISSTKALSGSDAEIAYREHKLSDFADGMLYYSLIAFVTDKAHLSVFQSAELLSLMLSISSIAMLYLVLRNLSITRSERAFSSILTLLSPGFISVSLFSMPDSAAIFLSISVAYIFTRNKITGYTLAFSAFLSVLIPFFSIPCAISLLIAISSYFFVNRNFSRHMLVLFSAVFVPSALLGMFRIFYTNTFQAMIGSGILSYYLSDFGSKTGLGVFSVILGITGIVFLRRKLKPAGRFVIWSSSLLFILTFFDSRFLLYLNIVLSISAGIGLVGMFKKEWDLPAIKFLSKIIFICGILFSAISFINAASEQPPYRSHVLSLEWINENSDPGDVIFTLPEYSFWVHSFADRKTFIDSSTTNATLVNESFALLYGRNLDTAEDILHRRNIRFIWVPPEMRESVWKSGDDGLLFLLKNSREFKIAYSKNGINIWYVTEKSDDQD